jgi:hypothetical protein
VIGHKDHHPFKGVVPISAVVLKNPYMALTTPNAEAGPPVDGAIADALSGSACASNPRPEHNWRIGESIAKQTADRHSLDAQGRGVAGLFEPLDERHEWGRRATVLVEPIRHRSRSAARPDAAGNGRSAQAGVARECGRN